MAERRPLSDIMNAAQNTARGRLSKQRDYVAGRFDSPTGQVRKTMRQLQDEYRNMTPEEMDLRAEKAGHQDGECDCELCAMIGYMETEALRGKPAETEEV